MVFSSSVPLYLDSPNWQQHPNQQVLQDSSASGRNNSHDQTQHLIHQPPPLPQPPGQSPLGMGGGGGGGGSPGGPLIRPNSMAERARLAKIPPPETPLKCPRCESTNTKFCYFNNYNLSQPRHFCKTCRRYWTRGGALRNVPVGGGCRRNKRSSSKSSSGGGGGGSSSSKSSLTSPSALVGGDRIPLHMGLVTTSALIPTISGLPSPGGGTGMSSFMASLQNMSQLGMGNLGLSFGGALNTPPHPLGGLAILASGTHGGGGSGGGDHHLDFPQLNPSSTNPQVQFPNMWGGFEIPGSSNSAAAAGLYTSTFQSDQGVGGDNSVDHQEHENNGLPKSGSSDMNSQIAPIKTEDDGQGLNNIHKQLMNISSSDNNNNASGNQFWAGGNIGNNTTGVTSMWTDLSGLNSSSTGHLL